MESTEARVVGSVWVMTTGPWLQRIRHSPSDSPAATTAPIFFLYFSHATQRPGLKTRPLIKISYPLELTSRVSLLGIATGYGLDDRGVGVRVPVRSKIFSSPRRPDRL
jgi:hypothetical protein